HLPAQHCAPEVGDEAGSGGGDDDDGWATGHGLQPASPTALREGAARMAGSTVLRPEEPGSSGELLRVATGPRQARTVALEPGELAALPAGTARLRDPRRGTEAEVLRSMDSVCRPKPSGSEPAIIV